MDKYILSVLFFFFFFASQLNVIFFVLEITSGVVEVIFTLKKNLFMLKSNSNLNKCCALKCRLKLLEEEHLCSYGEAFLLDEQILFIE